MQYTYEIFPIYRKGMAKYIAPSLMVGWELDFMRFSISACLVAFIVLLNLPNESSAKLKEDSCIDVLKSDVGALEAGWVQQEDQVISVEQLVWESICRNRYATLAIYRDDAVTLDVAFIQRILTEKKFIDVMPQYGIRIEVARFIETLRLNAIRFRQHIIFRQCVFEQGFQMRQATIEGSLVLSGSIFLDTVDIRQSTVKENLVLRGCPTEINSCRSGAPKSEPSIETIPPAIAPTLFQELDLGGIKVLGTLYLEKIHVKKDLKLRRASVGKDLSLSNNAHFYGNIDMRDAKIKGSLKLDGGHFLGENIDLSGLSVNDSITLNSTNNGPAIWGKNSVLNLMNASTRFLDDLNYLSAWPNTLELDGLIYQHHSTSDPFLKPRPAPRSAEWFLSWINRDIGYSPQPYEKLAEVLKRQGENEIGDNILYQKWEVERERAWCVHVNQPSNCIPQFGEALQLQALKWTIGYGLKYKHTVWCIIILWISGILALQVSGQARANNMRVGALYSLDILLPAIKLREKNYDESHVNIQGICRYYFYFHHLCGYILGFYLIAGLTNFMG